MCVSKLKEFHGNSHCKVELFEESCGSKFIRKTSTSFEYDLRLLRQFTKQRLFHRLHICTPQVYKCGKDSQGHFFFDMEFVDGQTLSEKLFDLSEAEIIELMNSFFGKVISEKKTVSTSNNKIIIKKVLELEESLSVKDDKITVALDAIRKFDYSGIPVGLCAGDMTLENLIYKDGKLYVIDLLDSFFSSWLIDFAKIRQDTLLHWSFRSRELNSRENSLLTHIDEILVSKLKERDTSGYFEDACYHLILLNTLRIIPYCNKNDRNYEFCIDALKKLI